MRNYNRAKVAKILESILRDDSSYGRERSNSAGAIIIKEKDGRPFVLLIKRSRKDHWPLHWEYPRGKCDRVKNEDLQECIKREVKEETGLDIIPGSVVGKQEYIADHGTRHVVCYVFLCKMVDENQEVKLSKEHDGYKWIGEVGEAQLILNPDQFKILEKVLNPERSILAKSTIDDVIESLISNDNFGGN